MRRRQRPHRYPPKIVRERRKVPVSECTSSWDYVVRTDPDGSLRDWERTVQRVESDGLFPKHGLTIAQEIARVTRPAKEEPQSLLFQFYFSGTPSEARAAASNFMQVLRRMVRESGLEHARMNRQ